MKKICLLALAVSLKLQAFYGLKPVNSKSKRKQRCWCKAIVYLNGPDYYCMF